MFNLKKNTGLALLAGCLFLFGCSGYKVALENGGKVTKNDVSVWATWIKDKGKKFDLQFNIQNSSKHDVVIMLSDMGCSRGNSPGQLKHTFFNTGERVIDIKVGQMKSFNLVCNYQVQTEGDFKVSISRVYDNPGGDGRTTGKVVSSDIVWLARQGY